MRRDLFNRFGLRRHLGTCLGEQFGFVEQVQLVRTFLGARTKAMALQTPQYLFECFYAALLANHTLTEAVHALLCIGERLVFAINDFLFAGE